MNNSSAAPVLLTFLILLSCSAHPPASQPVEQSTTAPTADGAPPPVGSTSAASQTESPLPAPDPVSPATREQVVEAKCDRIAACDAALFSSRYGNRNACIEKLHAQTFSDACKAYNETLGARCIQSSNAMTCADFLAILNHQKPTPPSCIDMCKNEQ
ncbi:MAG: hypothetical protein JXX29_09765 [Deltaproteobacteria bacterium]|nr:hypothetical protein [Deltaproteobacteria bacterium]MBN2671952.1 hypothetical protein [Deltaproteobacteria bacterium]